MDEKWRIVYDGQCDSQFDLPIASQCSQCLAVSVTPAARVPDVSVPRKDQIVRIAFPGD